MDKIKFQKMGDRTFLTGAVRCSFPHVFEKHSFENQEPAYSITLLIPKDDPMLGELKQVMKAALNEKFNGKIPASWHNPVMDGDEKAEKYPEMAGFYTLKMVDKKNQPLVVDRNKVEIMNQKEIYAGCWVRVKFEVYAFDRVTKGVGLGLRLVQKIADGEPFGNQTVTTTDDLPDLPPEASGSTSFGDGWD